MGRTGAVIGSLSLYPATLVFAAAGWEDNLRESSTLLMVELGEVTDVRVVPSRAGADGRQRKRSHQSRYPRLVLETKDVVHLFDVAFGRANKLAEELKSRTGVVA